MSLVPQSLTTLVEQFADYSSKIRVSFPKGVDHGHPPLPLHNETRIDPLMSLAALWRPRVFLFSLETNERLSKAKVAALPVAARRACSALSSENEEEPVDSGRFVFAWCISGLQGCVVSFTSGDIVFPISLGHWSFLFVCNSFKTTSFFGRLG